MVNMVVPSNERCQIDLQLTNHSWEFIVNDLAFLPI